MLDVLYLGPVQAMEVIIIGATLTPNIMCTPLLKSL
jgi:hypothetical protein